VKIRVVTAVMAAAVLWFATAGPATAQPFGQKAGPPQVTGTQLWTAILPLSAFGSGFTFLKSLRTGDKLESTKVKLHVPSMSCSTFASEIYIAGLGNTAAVAVKYFNPAWLPTYPNTIIEGEEYVLQFAGSATATAFYNQVRAKYVACGYFDTTSFLGPSIVDTLSVAPTSVSGDRAFVVTQRLSAPGIFEGELYLVYLWVVAGTNVYNTGVLSGTNDEPSPALMSTLIHRVQALYPHH
jgi:hypothetical protein